MDFMFDGDALSPLGCLFIVAVWVVVMGIGGLVLWLVLRWLSS